MKKENNIDKTNGKCARILKTRYVEGMKPYSPICRPPMPEHNPPKAEKPDETKKTKK